MKIIVNAALAIIGTILLPIIVCVLGIAAIVAVMILAEKLMAPEDFLFYEHGPVASVIIVWLIMIPVILLGVIVAAKIKKKSSEQMENMNDILYLWNHLGKWRLAVVAIWGVSLYWCLTSVTYVTEDSIIYCSPTHPLGITYEYSDVEEIRTGFGKSTISIAEYRKKGNFFYQIKLDGRKITFHTPSTNEEIERYTEDSYLELEEFDKVLTRLGIPKTGDEKGYENCDFDQRYVERFLRIIRRKD